jgi:hypothetical protein
LISVKHRVKALWYVIDAASATAQEGEISMAHYDQARAQDGCPVTKRSFLLSPAGLVLIAFLAISGVYLWMEHRAHLLGALVWLPLLACPLMHLFMHHGHGGHHGGKAPPPGSGDVK